MSEHGYCAVRKGGSRRLSRCSRSACRLDLAFQRPVDHLVDLRLDRDGLKRVHVPRAREDLQVDVGPALEPGEAALTPQLLVERFAVRKGQENVAPAVTQAVERERELVADPLFRGTPLDAPPPQAPGVSGHLSRVAGKVTGLDIGPAMVEYCRATYPEAAFVVGDMRELPFPGGAFDVVVGIDNVMDAVGHEDRLTVLAEVRRVLAPRGVYLFSTHNRAHAPWAQGPRIPRSRNPARVIRCLRNRRRLRPLQRIERDYSILNDCGHDYAVLHYYIDRATQERQLHECGFEALLCMDHTGRELLPEETVPGSAHIHYGARRA